MTDFLRNLYSFSLTTYILCTILNHVSLIYFQFLLTTFTEFKIINNFWHLFCSILTDYLYIV